MTNFSPRTWYCFPLLNPTGYATSKPQILTERPTWRSDQPISSPGILYSTLKQASRDLFYLMQISPLTIFPCIHRKHNLFRGKHITEYIYIKVSILQLVYVTVWNNRKAWKLPLKKSHNILLTQGHYRRKSSGKILRKLSKNFPDEFLQIYLNSGVYSMCLIIV